MKALAGKTAVITGAASGIGRALALQCAQAGAQVAICDVAKAELEETARLISAQGGTVFALTVDVSSSVAMQAFAKAVEARFAGADVLINNAGVSLSQLLEHTTKEQMEWIFSINFWGVVHGCNAFLPLLRRSKQAHIVNISSLFGLIPMNSQGAYVASKFAVRGYTETLVIELAGSGIAVSCVHPGGVKTGIARNGRHFDAANAEISAQQVAQEFERIAQTSPERAAAMIIDGIQHRRPRIMVGLDAIFGDFLQRLSPSLVRKILILISMAMNKRKFANAAPKKGSSEKVA